MAEMVFQVFRPQDIGGKKTGKENPLRLLDQIDHRLLGGDRHRLDMARPAAALEPLGQGGHRPRNGVAHPLGGDGFGFARPSQHILFAHGQLVLVKNTAHATRSNIIMP